MRLCSHMVVCVDVFIRTFVQQQQLYAALLSWPTQTPYFLGNSLSASGDSGRLYLQSQVLGPPRPLKRGWGGAVQQHHHSHVPLPHSTAILPGGFGHLEHFNGGGCACASRRVSNLTDQRVSSAHQPWGKPSCNCTAWRTIPTGSTAAAALPLGIANDR